MAPFRAKPLLKAPSGSTRENAKARHVQAFTLVELLVAMAVLSILVLMIAALTNGASFTIANSAKHLNADDQARLVFDRMQMDFARMLKRSDVYFQFLKQTGSPNYNDQFTFYSETPGFPSSTATTASESNLSLVNYQIPNSSSNPNSLPANQYNQLMRGSQGYQWTDPNYVAFNPNPSTAPTVSSSDYHVLSSSVFRMEIAFLLRQDDTHVQITSTAPTPGNQAFQNFYAVVVAIAVLDPNSQKLVSASSYPTLIAALPDFPSASIPSPQTMSLSTATTTATIDPILSVWNTAVNASNFAQTAGIPSAAAQQVRIYQRVFYLQ